MNLFAYDLNQEAYTYVYQAMTDIELNSITIEEVIALKKESKYDIPRTFIVMTPFAPQDGTSSVSAVGQVILDRYGLVPHHMVFLTVKTHRVPFREKERYTITKFFESQSKGSVTGVILHYGFMERPTVEADLLDLAKKNAIPTHKDKKLWTMTVLGKRFFYFKGMTLLHEIIMHLYSHLYLESKSFDEYYGLGNRIRLSIAVLPVKTKE